jgi:hypothetical protein
MGSSSRAAKPFSGDALRLRQQVRQIWMSTVPPDLLSRGTETMNDTERSVAARAPVARAPSRVRTKTDRILLIALAMMIVGTPVPSEGVTNDGAGISTAIPTLTVWLPAETSGRITVFDEEGNVILATAGEGPGVVDGVAPEGTYWVAISRIEDRYPAVLARTDIRRDWVSVVRVSDLPYSTRHRMDRIRAEIDGIDRRLTRSRISRGAAYALLSVAAVGTGLAAYSFVRAEGAVAAYNSATTTKETAAARDGAEHWGGHATVGTVTAAGGLALGGGSLLVTRGHSELAIEKDRLERELDRLSTEFVSAESENPLLGRPHG